MKGAGSSSAERKFPVFEQSTLIPANMFTRSRRTSVLTTPVDPVCDDGNSDYSEVTSSEQTDTSISVNIITTVSSEVIPDTAVTTVSELLWPISPTDALDTPTITRLLLSSLEGVQCGVPTITTPTLTPTTLKNIQQSFLQAASCQVQPPERHNNQAGFVPPPLVQHQTATSTHHHAGTTIITLDNKSWGGGTATILDPSSVSSSTSNICNVSSTAGLILDGPPPLLPISATNILSGSITNTNATISCAISSTINSDPINAIISSGSINSSSSTFTNSFSGPLIINNPSEGSSSSSLPLIVSNASSLPLVVSSVVSGLPPLPPSSPMPGASLSVYSSDDSDTVTSLDNIPPSRRMGGRRPNRDDKLSEEEEQKRHVRRERNKMAAARCRKRRLDQTNTLQDETDRLEDKKSSLQHEIQVLQQQRDELEFLLATHKPVCTRGSRNKSALPSSVIVTTSSRAVVSGTPPQAFTTDPLTVAARKMSQPVRINEVFVKVENTSDSEEYGSLFSTIIPGTTPVSATPAVSSIAMSLSLTPSHISSLREKTIPHSHSKPTRPTSLAVAPLTELGVSIETPSTGLRGFNFESMMEGGTGLTPVTPLSLTALATGMTPLTTPIVTNPSSISVTSANSHCGYQQRSSSSELSSPDSLPSKQLVSL